MSERRIVPFLRAVADVADRDEAVGKLALSLPLGAEVAGQGPEAVTAAVAEVISLADERRMRASNPSASKPEDPTAVLSILDGKHVVLDPWDVEPTRDVLEAIEALGELPLAIVISDLAVLEQLGRVAADMRQNRGSWQGDKLS